MKKALFLILSLVLCLGLWACNDTKPCEHNFKISDITAATCTESGSKTLQCTLCGISYTEETPAIGHDYSAANCTTAQSCVLCGKTEGKPLGHNWKEASCTEPKICGNCGLESGDALGHNYSDATCASAKTCATCGKTEGNPLEHSWSEATCATPKTCVHCQSTEGEALEHTWLDATCTAPKTCTTCGQSSGEALDHSCSEATCIAPQTCLLCGETVGEALGHEYESKNVLEACCSFDGRIQHTCKRCTHSYTEEYAAATYTATQIYAMYKNTVGEIITYDEFENEIGIGTCIVYSSDGKLVTNYHVLEGAHSAKVKIGEQIYIVQDVLAFDKFIDLAIVQIQATGLKPAVWCRGDHPAGKTVYALGSSYGLTLTLSQGIISYGNRQMNGVKYVQHNAPISEGNSGGPLINEYGEVIGINTMSLLDAQNLNFAVHAGELPKISWSKMTMEAFYNYSKENDPFVKMKNHLISRGTYDKENKCYLLTQGYTIMFNRHTYYAYRIDRVVCYFEEENIIALNAVVNGGENVLSIIILPDVSGIYEWSYYDVNEYVMAGLIEARVIEKDTTLEYAYNNVSNANVRANIRSLITSMANEILKRFDYNWQDAGVTVKELDFMKF